MDQLSLWNTKNQTVFPCKDLFFLRMGIEKGIQRVSQSAPKFYSRFLQEALKIVIFSIATFSTILNTKIHEKTLVGQMDGRTDMLTSIEKMILK